MLQRFSISIALFAMVLTQQLFAQEPSPKSATIASSNADDAEREQVAAAVANASSNLRKDIEHSWIGADLTVADFVRRVDGEDSFRQSIHSAQQIGGPRWVDAQTCQIRLELSGRAVAQSLIDLAHANADRTPIAEADLSRRLEAWNDRTFAATGSSIRADRVRELRPSGVESWRDVDDASRIAAIESAREDAVDHVVDQVKSIRLDEKTTAGDLLKNETFQKYLRDWLRARPVTSLQFLDDHRVQYTMALSRRKLFEQFSAEARRQGIAIGSDEDAFAAVRDQFHQEITSMAGSAIARVTAASNAKSLTAVNIPKQPPSWIDQSIEVTERIADTGSPLRTRQIAEDGAAQSIRNRLLALPWSGDTTVDRAGSENPIIRSAIDHAMEQARVYNVDYGADGSVTIKMSLDSREFWYEVSSSR